MLPRRSRQVQQTYFDTAVIERRLDGRKIEGTDDQGWAWYELDKIDPRAEVRPAPKSTRSG